MKTVTGLHFSRAGQAARVVLLLIVIAALAVMIADMMPRTEEAAPTGSDRHMPAERSHYNFPTYA